MLLALLCYFLGCSAGRCILSVPKSPSCTTDISLRLPASLSLSGEACSFFFLGLAPGGGFRGESPFLLPGWGQPSTPATPR